MIDKLSPKECALCGSCVDACPTGAISFKKEYLDFSYPTVDAEKCINCGLCEKACPVISVRDGAGDEPKPRVYAAKNPDDTIRRSSSSGGIFWALAQTILSQSGYVCGAVFDENFRVHHLVSNEEATVRRMMGSKYAQSDLTGVYKQVKKLLRRGETVLFTGCPCQVAALHSHLGKTYEKLITVDVVCHGVPSNTMLRAYLDLQEKRKHAKTDAICFRDKKHGWHRSSVRIKFAGGAEYCTPIIADAYMNGFLGGIFIKESCYNCKFKNFHSQSDLTLADFWGAEAVYPELDDNKGLSAVIANSPNGDAFLGLCGIDLWESSLDTVARYNRNLVAPTKKNPLRESFYEFAKDHGYSGAIKAMLWERPFRKICRESRYLLRRMAYAILGREKPLY